MMRRVWPVFTRWIHGARAATISSWTTVPGSGGGSVLMSTSAKEVVLDVLEGAQAFRSRVTDGVVRPGDRPTPGRRPHRGHRIGGPGVDHVGAVGQHHDHVHLGP